MPKIEEHTKNILETEKKRKILFWILNKNYGNIFVYRQMFLSATSPAVLCTYTFVLNHFYAPFLPPRIAHSTSKE